MVSISRSYLFVMPKQWRLNFETFLQNIKNNILLYMFDNNEKTSNYLSVFELKI